MIEEKVNFWVASSERTIKLFRDPMFFPMMFTIFVCWMSYQWIPKIATGHIELLDTTSKTLESMGNTLDQTQPLLEKLVEQPYPSEDFRKEVNADHAAAQEELLETKAVVEETQKKVEEIHKAVHK